LRELISAEIIACSLAFNTTSSHLASILAPSYFSSIDYKALIESGSVLLIVKRILAKTVVSL
jgi:hypothetical protein